MPTPRRLPTLILRDSVWGVPNYCSYHCYRMEYYERNLFSFTYSLKISYFSLSSQKVTDKWAHSEGVSLFLHSARELTSLVTKSFKMRRFSVYLQTIAVLAIVGSSHGQLLRKVRQGPGIGFPSARPMPRSIPNPRMGDIPTGKSNTLYCRESFICSDARSWKHS
jgi:hypothetical protein